MAEVLNTLPQITQLISIGTGVGRDLGDSSTWVLSQLLFSCQAVSDSFGIPWTVARQTPLSMGFPRQEHWNGLPFPSPGDRPYSGIEPVFLALQGRFLTTGPTGKPPIIHS